MKTIIIAIAFALTGVLANAQTTVSSQVSEAACRYPLEKIAAVFSGFQNVNVFKSADAQPGDCQLLWNSVLKEDLFDIKKWEKHATLVEVYTIKIGTQDRLYATIDRKEQKIYFHLEELLPDSAKKQLRLIAEADAVRAN